MDYKLNYKKVDTHYVYSWEVEHMFRDIADVFIRNVLYRYPKVRSFTASDVVQDMCGDSTGLPRVVTNRLRRMADQKIVVDHPTGPKKVVVRDKGRYGRTGRPQNLYKFVEAS